MAVSAISSTAARPKTQHVADSNIQAFLQQDFDPADYLNSTLPTLSATGGPRGAPTTQHGRAIPLSELSSQLQTLLSQLNAQTTRLSNTLTQLTDEIIRSGGRLAYEVEVLRGEATGLTDTLDDGLRKDIELFSLQGVDKADFDPTAEAGQTTNGEGTAEARIGALNEPEYLERLRTLTAVRSRLDAVIKVFGDAMAWPVAPSEFSGVASSFISVSTPESEADSRSREEKAKDFAEKLRAEINEVIGTGNDMSSLEAAAAKLDELRQLAEVWKGTAEEKARLKLVESLRKPVEEREKALGRTGQSRKPIVPSPRGADYRYGNLDTSRAVSEGGYGFLNNLRKLKDEMYLD